MAYVAHKQDILDYIKKEKEEEIKERKQAKKYGLLMTCQCCFDEEILEKDSVGCDLSCIFCKQCVQKSVEIAFGEGKLEFSCLSNCTAHFSLPILQVNETTIFIFHYFFKNTCSLESRYLFLYDLFELCSPIAQ